MNVLIIKILGFLIGLFTTLVIIDIYDIKRKKVETFENKPIIPLAIPKEPEQIIKDNLALIPYNSYKYMCINTFFDITKIDNNNNRWYECDLEKDKEITTNEKSYFTFDKIINVKPNTINNNGAYGADINGVELRQKVSISQIISIRMKLVNLRF